MPQKYNSNNKDAVRFRQHRQKYPRVYNWIAETARTAKWEKGYGKWSVSAAVEIIRWSGRFKLEKDEQGYMINDHVASYYAREIMMKEPDLYGFFETRIGNADWEPLGMNNETWADFEMAKLEAERQAQYEEELETA
jgi:hypothetical protein